MKKEGVPVDAKVAAILLATLFSFAYAFKFIDLILFQKEKNDILIVNKINGKACLGGLTLITLLNLYIGMNNQYLLDVTHQISQLILK